MKKIRVAYFIDAYQPGAGTENQLKGVLKHLDPARVEARLFTLRDEVREEHRREIPWPIVCLKIKSLVSLESVIRFWGLMCRLRREKYDVVSVYFNDSNFFIVPACRLAGIKCVVVNRRNMGYELHEAALKRLNWINRWADYFLVNSNAVKRNVMEQEGFPAERIKVIYNGLWDNPGREEESEPAAELNIPVSAKVVGIVANLRPVKRINRFIDMAARVTQTVPEARFVVVGGGELEGELRQQAQALNLTGTIQFIGSVANVYPYLKRFDVGILTSESEGLSNTLMEYLCSGIPAVAFDTGGNREVITDGISGYLVGPDQVESMAEKVISLLSDDIGRCRMGIAGREFVQKTFAPDRIMEETMNFYEVIVTAPKRSWRAD